MFSGGIEKQNRAVMGQGYSKVSKPNLPRNGCHIKNNP